MRSCDGFLLDRVFQPVVNWLRLHPVDIAMRTAVVSTLFNIIAVLTQLKLLQPTMISSILLFLAGNQLVAFYIVWLTFPHIRDHIQPLQPNPYRNSLFITRIVVLLATLGFAGVWTGLMFTPWGLASGLTLPTTLVLLGQILWTITVYLESCEVHGP